MICPHQNVAAWSSKQRPLHTVDYLAKRFAKGMVSTEGADVILDSRANNPNVTDLQIREVAPLQFAGTQGFRAVFDFRLNTPDDLSMLLGTMTVLDVSGRKTPYRSVYYGFMLGQWFYGISYVVEGPLCPSASDSLVTFSLSPRSIAGSLDTSLPGGSHPIINSKGGDM